MTAFLELTQALVGRMEANWPIVHPEVPFYLDNLTIDPQAQDEFITFQIRRGDSSQQSVGDVTARLFRHPGVIDARIFTKADTGEGRGLELADDLAAIFRGITVGGMRLYAPSVYNDNATLRGETNQTTGAWWMTQVICPFQYDKRF